MFYKRKFGKSVFFFLMLGIMSCSVHKDKKIENMSQEIAQHIEQVGEGNIITKVYEERKDGIFTIRIEVIKNGHKTETIHHFDSENFSISIPVSAHIMMQSVQEAGKSPDSNVLLFTQKLELARKEMLKTDYIAALEALNQALNIDSYNPQAHMMKGSIFYSMGKIDLAQKEFEYVLKVDPENSEVKRFKEFIESEEKGSQKVKIERTKQE